MMGDDAGRATLLDDLMPRWDECELHDIWLDAPVEACWQALLALEPREVRLLTPLMAIRQLPAWLMGRAKRPKKGGASLLEELEKAGFVPLAEEPGRELVYGVIGRFWLPTGNISHSASRDRSTFESFAEPRYAKAVMSFLARREGRGTRLLTETRVLATDAAARRRFWWYWRLVRLGSGAIRRSWLAAVRRRVSRATARAR